MNETRARPLMYGRHFSWVARLAVKIAKELALTDEQFLRMMRLVIQELEKTSDNFSRELFIDRVKVAAYAARQNETVLETMEDSCGG